MRNIEEQRRLYKDSKKSICKSCTNINEDCFEAFKICETDKGLSYVKSCAGLNRDLKRVEYVEKTIAVQAMQDSRQDSMGGGFQNVEKYKNDEIGR